MRKAIAVAAVIALATVTASADHNADEHTGSITHVATFDHGDRYRQGTDLAFWGNLAVLGSYDNPGGFRLLDVSDPAKPALVGQLSCPGSQNDVSIWNGLVFLSVDSARSDASCTSSGASPAQVAQGTHWEGLRVVSIADPAKPKVLANVETDCGSHTHTLLPQPERGRLLVYVLSYPLTSGLGPKCNAASHRKISVVEVPLADPSAAKVISTPGVGLVLGCHDVTLFTERKLAAAACITESQLWDISDPVAPSVIARIRNPLVNIHHSTAFSNDGRTIVIGDELGGAVVTPGCLGEGHLPLGALWFYDVGDPTAPAQRGFFRIENSELSILCTAHNFNVVPLTTDRDLLVTGWYNGGTAVVDFTDPSAPVQLARYTPKTDAQAAAWSSYWYNGYIYSNNFDEDVNSTTARSRGFDVFRFTDASVNAAVRLPYLNAQTQLPLPKTVVLSRRVTAAPRPALPATGATDHALIGWVLLAAAGVAASRLGRRPRAHHAAHRR